MKTSTPTLASTTEAPIADEVLEVMSSAQLQWVIKQATKYMSAAKKRERDAALVELERVAQKYGFTLKELVGDGKTGSKKSPKAAKYRNPDDSSQTWSGAGRQPGWYRDAIAAGNTPEDLAI